jgi:hypothetical protein
VRNTRPKVVAHARLHDRQAPDQAQAFGDMVRAAARNRRAGEQELQPLPGSPRKQSDERTYQQGHGDGIHCFALLWALENIRSTTTRTVD